MSGPLEDLTELRTLLEALCEESITPEQVARLEELVLAHPEAEAFYVQYMSLQADLARHFGLPAGRARPPAGVGGNPAGRPRPAGAAAPRRASRIRRIVWGGLGLAAAAAAVVIALAPWRGPPVDPLPNAAVEASDNTVAVLLQAPGARWDDSELPTRPGAPLPPGWLRLKAGFAHLEFYSGATVILEGPAELKLVSSGEAYCALGKLRATVPPQAQGFTVGGPALDLVDRGTEFGLEVGADHRTEVHVFQGKVELYDAGSDHAPAARKELQTGQGVRLDGPGPLLPIPANPASFKTAHDLAKRAEEEARLRHQDWLTASEALRRDPCVVVYYPFQAEGTWSRTLLDQALGRKEPHDGAIVGCAWVAGRWPGKQALEFKQVSDRVRLHVPGEFSSLTLAAWVRVDALPNRFNSLFMTDGWEEAAPHWHISDRGRIELGVQGLQARGGVHYLTGPVITPDRLGRWVHLAVVYDRLVGLVTHYADGRPVHRDPLKSDLRLRLGDAEIGNWNLGPRPHNHPIRYFSGCMDEFVLFSRALDEAEVQRLYEQGRPSS
jgi:ferric-dicitrate binding protein FerR (iron transport regulator)